MTTETDMHKGFAMEGSLIFNKRKRKKETDMHNSFYWKLNPLVM